VTPASCVRPCDTCVRYIAMNEKSWRLVLLLLGGGGRRWRDNLIERRRPRYTRDKAREETLREIDNDEEVHARQRERERWIESARASILNYISTNLCRPGQYSGDKV
jgi:hypothetical protein